MKVVPASRVQMTSPSSEVETKGERQRRTKPRLTNTTATIQFSLSTRVGGQRQRHLALVAVDDNELKKRLARPPSVIAT